MSKKKKKVRVSFRKNRQARTRESGLTRQFEQHGFEDDETTRREQLTGKGELAKKIVPIVYATGTTMKKTNTA